MRVSGGILTAVLSLGCEGTDVEQLPFDSGTVVADTAPFDEVVASIPRCGPGPYFFQTVRLSKDWGDRGALTAARVSIDACPDVVAETDSKGFATIATTVNVPYDILLEHPEMPAEAVGIFRAQLPMFLWMFQVPVDPKLPYDPALPTLRVYALAAGTAPPCTVAGGLEVSVEGHPEARVRYIHDGVDVGTDPTKETVPLIDGLPEGALVSVIGRKPGCRVRKDGGPSHSGMHRVRKKFVTTVNLLIDDVPDAG